MVSRNAKLRMLLTLLERPLVYLAALTMILQLLIGPFVQQTIQTLSRDFAISAIAEVPIVAYFHLGFSSNLSANAHDNYVPARRLPSEFKLAAERGFLDIAPFSISDVNASCETERCSFPPYKSIGICADMQPYNASINSSIPCEMVEHCAIFNRYPLIRLQTQSGKLGHYAAPFQTNSSADSDLLGSIGELYLFRPQSIGYHFAVKMQLNWCVYELETSFGGRETQTTILNKSRDVQIRDVQLDDPIFDVPTLTMVDHYIISKEVHLAFADYFATTLFNAYGPASTVVQQLLNVIDDVEYFDEMDMPENLGSLRGMLDSAAMSLSNA